MTTREQINLQFDISSFWHIGSGRGRDAVLDAEVARNAQGLPYIPGKTIKGLLRQAMTLLAEAKGQPLTHVIELFGSQVPAMATVIDEQTDLGDANARNLEAGRYNTTPGCLWFGSAEMPQDWQDWARTNPSAAAPTVQTLFRAVASTAIDERGVAREHTLRVAEVTVPMTLTSTVIGPAALSDGTNWVSLVSEALPFVRALGVRRRRGYGRVAVRLEKAGSHK
jgi:CRISPR/Cas system CSM-associated protein Csm3 (group 7 of RAMP superfamily)